MGVGAGCARGRRRMARLCRGARGRVGRGDGRRAGGGADVGGGGGTGGSIVCCCCCCWCVGGDDVAGMVVVVVSVLLLGKNKGRTGTAVVGTAARWERVDAVRGQRRARASRGV